MDELNLHKADYPFYEFRFCPLSFSPWCINIARLLHNAHPVHWEQMQIAGLIGIVILCVLLQRAPKELHGALNILTDSTSNKKEFLFWTLLCFEVHEYSEDVELMMEFGLWFNISFDSTVL